VTPTLFVRAAKLIAVAFADLFVYVAVLSISLRLGPEGLGPRLLQLCLAVAVPAALTRRLLCRKKRRWDLRKPLVGMAAGGFLSPPFIAQIPLASLSLSVALLASPYYAPQRAPGLLGEVVRRSGLSEVTAGGYLRQDFVLLKRHVYYFRWWGGDLGKGFKVIREGGQEYLKVASVALSDPSCRRRALARALKAAEEGRGIAVPATAEEGRLLGQGEEVGEDLLGAAREERAAFAALAVATRKRLTCARAGDGTDACRASDVVVRERGGVWKVKVLSGREMEIEGERLRELLDLYGMVVAG